ncbi:MAG: FeoB-associated Cys-rich membrane protein [Eubacteriales bacterium]
MIQFLIDNAATIIVSAVLLTLFTLAIRSMIRRRKKSSCASGNSCSGCPYSNNCH